MTYQFDGQYEPNGGIAPMQGQQTFSLGVFEELPTKSGGVKRMPVTVRVKGPVSRADDVRKLAEIVAAKLDYGLSVGVPYYFPKTVGVDGRLGRSLLRNGK